MTKGSISKQVLAVICILLLITGLSGCNSRPTDRGLFSYRIDGAMVVDLNLDRTTIVLTVDRNDEVLSSANISIDGRQLVWNPFWSPFDSSYTLVVDSTLPFVGREVSLIFKDGSNFSDTLAINVPDTFSITEIIPFNRLVQGATNVSMSWTGAPGSMGYQLAAVHIDSLYREYGFATLNPTGTNSGTIPSDAFFLSNPIQPDTGIYNVYVYALGGSLDSLFASPFMPTPMAQQFGDNIDETDLTGLFGSVVIVETDTVHVVSQN